ncbi:MAG TPA: hypothetical protein VMV24_03005 [Candidatus Dormibacteraeota bacterium]|nr:hypothetical protein [Candidatus Dormibacteraeota bacterium]
MECYICDRDTKVINSRAQSRLKQVWRRRVCTNCAYIFTTIEKIDLERSMVVKAEDGSMYPFIREKLLMSISKSLGHRTNHVNEAVALTNTILSKLQTTYKTPLLTRNNIILTSEEVLKNFDNAALIHYSAYHKIS